MGGGRTRRKGFLDQIQRLGGGSVLAWHVQGPGSVPNPKIEQATKITGDACKIDTSMSRTDQKAQELPLAFMRTLHMSQVTVGIV